MQKFRPGDIIQWAVGHTAGEAHVVGYLAADDSVLVVAIGAQYAEIPAADCAPTRFGIVEYSADQSFSDTFRFSLADLAA